MSSSQDCGRTGGAPSRGGEGGDGFALTAAERREIEHAMAHYEDPRAASIDALKAVQRHRGWVSDGAIDAIAAVLGIAAADVDGVATFYNRIYRQPVGRHVISVCDSVACFLTGYEELKAELQQRLGVQYGQTTPDGRFTIMMPHPERVFRASSNSWRPDEWGEDGPWLRLFRNARRAVG